MIMYSFDAFSRTLVINTYIYILELNKDSVFPPAQKTHQTIFIYLSIYSFSLFIYIYMHMSHVLWSISPIFSPVLGINFWSLLVTWSPTKETKAWSKTWPMRHLSQRIEATDVTKRDDDCYILRFFLFIMTITASKLEWQFNQWDLVVGFEGIQ